MPNGPISILGSVKGNGPQSIITSSFIPFTKPRFFRRNEGTTDYISHPSATVDRIVMEVYPSAGNVGLPTGAPAVVNNKIQTIDFVYSGTIGELCKNGTNYFKGIIANVEYYLSGVLIHNYRIDDGVSHLIDVVDTVGGNHGTVINGSAQDWVLFNQLPNGSWEGPELMVNGDFRQGFDSWANQYGKWQIDTSGGSQSYHNGAYMPPTQSKYFLRQIFPDFNIAAIKHLTWVYHNSNNARVSIVTGTSIGKTGPTQITTSGAGSILIKFKDANYLSLKKKLNTGTLQIYFNNFSLKEVLDV